MRTPKDNPIIAINRWPVPVSIKYMVEPSIPRPMTKCEPPESHFHRTIKGLDAEISADDCLAVKAEPYFKVEIEPKFDKIRSIPRRVGETL